jgi:peptidoglycan hydrolase-like protein with peptidoglycan-binding domain
VRALEDRLTALRYDVSATDGVYDQNTAYAVVAFQKVSGLPRTGRATQDVVDALSTAAPPGPLVPGGGPTRVEIDLPRQVLLLYQNDALARVLPVSTGSGQRFCADGRCRRAVTPAGSYRVGYHVDGWHKSPLGRLYNPLYYMVGVGIAIHGYPSVPPKPASKGCVRIPMSAAETFPDQVPDDTPVYVLDGRTPPRPAPPPGTET